MKVEKNLWKTTPDGKDIFLYRITNESGAYVELGSVGAGIVSIVVPDKEGKLADVVIGYDDPMSYFGDGPCAGKSAVHGEIPPVARQADVRDAAVQRLRRKRGHCGGEPAAVRPAGLRH